MIRTNGNRFSVYTSEEKTVLGVINELAQENVQVNKELDEINKVLEEKTDLYGDHKGTWQGLNRPTMSDEGIRATVEDVIDNRIPSIETSLEHKANQVDLVVERERINNIMAVNDSTDNLETADIRIAVDGRIYNSAGDSVRGQIGNLIYDIENITVNKDVPYGKALKEDSFTSSGYYKGICVPFKSNVDKFINKITTTQKINTISQEFFLEIREGGSNGKTNVLKQVSVISKKNVGELEEIEFNLDKGVYLSSNNFYVSLWTNMGYISVYQSEDDTNINKDLCSWDKVNRKIYYTASNSTTGDFGYTIDNRWSYPIISIYGRPQKVIDMSKINYNSPLYGKKINILGDSISSTDYALPNWWQQLETKTGCICTGYGISGTTLAHSNDRHLWDYHFSRLDANEIGYVWDNRNTWSTGNCFCERYVKMNDDADIIIVMGGTNDIDRAPIGQFAETQATRTEHFCKGVETLILGLKKKYPEKLIVFCTPIQMRDSYNYISITPSNEFKSISETNIETKVKGHIIAEAIKSKCRQYSIPCIDLFYESGICGPDDNNLYYLKDDIYHPTVLGHSIIMNNVLGKLNELIS